MIWEWERTAARSLFALCKATRSHFHREGSMQRWDENGHSHSAVQQEHCRGQLCWARKRSAMHGQHSWEQPRVTVAHWWPRTTTRHPNSSSSRPQPLRKKGLLWNESVKYREIQVSFSDTQSTAWLVRLTWGNGTGPATLIRQSPWDRGISFKAVLRVGWRCHLSHRKNCPRLPGKIVKRQQRFP